MNRSQTSAGLIRFDQVSLTFRPNSGRGPNDVLCDINFTVNAGDFISIIGPSGCGKTTLLTLLAGYIAPTAGQVLFNNKPIRGPSKERMMVFQQPSLFPWLTTAGNIAYGLKLKANKDPSVNVDETVASVLRLVQLEKFARYYPIELSGGMRQRLEIARALAVNPKVLLMDEPLGSLDALTRRTMQREVLRIWRETHKTILFVTHDIDEAVIMSDRIVVMTPRPSFVREITEVSLPHPRDRGDREVAKLSGHLSKLLE